MKNPKHPTTKERVEAIVRQLYLSGDHFEEEDVAVKEATDKIMALLNPVEAPSPNEAPKGEAGNKFVGYLNGIPVYSNPNVPENILYFVGDEPLAPDNEWESDLLKEFIHRLEWRLRDAKFRILDTKYQAGINTGIGLSAESVKDIFPLIRSLLLSKDQEADRRVAEAIGEIENFLSQYSSVTSDMLDDTDWNEIKNKLSPQK